MRVAVIGAGLAGLELAGGLQSAGHDVQVFEKARGPSGRLSTRRTETSGFDHGAQYFTAHEPAFKARVDGWLDEGVVEPWRGKIVSLEGAGANERIHVPVSDEITRYVGTPRMSSVGRSLSQKVELLCGVRLVKAMRTRESWTLECDAGFEYPDFDCVVVATPAPQAVPFLSEVPELQVRAAEIKMLPCHAVMISLARPLPVEFDGAFVSKSNGEPGKILSWVARNSSKPHRGDGCTWVLHSNSSWSEANVEMASADVIRCMLAAFEDVIGQPLAHVENAQSHRWLYARSSAPLGVDYLWDPRAKIGVCGDWLRGDRVEDAFESGHRLSEAILAVTAPTPIPVVSP